MVVPKTGLWSKSKEMLVLNLKSHLSPWCFCVPSYPLCILPIYIVEPMGQGLSPSMYLVPGKMDPQLEQQDTFVIQKNPNIRPYYNIQW